MITSAQMIAKLEAFKKLPSDFRKRVLDNTKFLAAIEAVELTEKDAEEYGRTGHKTSLGDTTSIEIDRDLYRPYLLFSTYDNLTLADFIKADIDAEMTEILSND